MQVELQKSRIPTRIKPSHTVILTIHKQIPTQQCPACAEEGSVIRIQKPSDCGVVVSALEVVESGLTTLLDCKISAEDIERIIESDELKEHTGKLTPEEKNTLKSILDPAYPLILCCPTGKTPYDRKETEVKWVTIVTKCLQKAFFDRAAADGKAYDAHNFWGSIKDKGDFGIISPHHEHIIRLKKEISDTPAPFAEDYGDLFIGTVDKLQGQEREAVVVSYGISDLEQAITEGEFVYSRNRLNVAITRAKKKCIVFLSDVVLDFPIEALAIDDEDVLKGIDYVCGFRDFMRKKEKDSEIDSCSVAGKLTVYRKRLKANCPADDNEQPDQSNAEPFDDGYYDPVQKMLIEEFFGKTGKQFKYLGGGRYEYDD